MTLKPTMDIIDTTGDISVTGATGDITITTSGYTSTINIPLTTDTVIVKLYDIEYEFSYIDGKTLLSIESLSRTYSYE